MDPSNHEGAQASCAAPAGPVAAPARGGPWRRFAARHLFDYNPAATRWWLSITAAGAAAAVWVASQLLVLPAESLLHVGAGVLIAVLAACFPVQIPRTKYAHSVADVFVFTLLAMYGPAAAAAAAAAEALAGVRSRRLSSLVASPAVALVGMLLAGVAFEGVRRALLALGWTEPPAVMAALCAASLPYVCATTWPLLALVALKNRRPLPARDWAEGYAWLAAIYLIAAAVAGVLAMNVRQFGVLVVVVAAAVAAAVLALVRLSLRRHEAERRDQEARIDSAEQEARMNQQRFAAAFSHAAIGMALVRPDGTIHQVNRALCTLLGIEEPALVGRRFEDLLHRGDAELFRRHAERGAHDGGDGGSIELRCRHRDGVELWVSLHRGRFIDPSHQGEGAIFQLHDISSRRRAEGQLQHIAYHDGLTDLANRHCFNERLAVAVERTRLDPSQRFAVMFLDLDRFKVVNDSLGHIAGNAMLREVGRRLTQHVRPADLVARLGGDEFAILAEQVDDPAQAMALADRLLAALGEPMRINGTEVVPSASIGITFSDLGYRTADEVLRDADLAMYEAKADERSRIALFDSEMLERVTEKLQLENDLRRAIGDGQLSLAFQPLFTLDPYRLEGFEALVRWAHPDRGPISPAVFVALAEEAGHIGALTAWVLDEAVAQLARWPRPPGTQAPGVHVNISGRDLADRSLAERVQRALERHGVDPGRLTLEITETTLMGRLDEALDMLGSLRRIGVHVSIDDFGTGYSSLAYLSTLPFDSLKIDRSFVIGMHAGEHNVEIVRTVANLGRTLGKTVIAEGIETPAQLALLKRIGVPVGQGYLLSRPLRGDQVPALIEQGVPMPIAAL